MKLFEAGSLWSYKDFRTLWISSTIFVIGASAFPIALAITILDAGGSATSLGLILASRILASVIFSPIAGVWADRVPRKTIMIVADIFRGVLVFGMVFVSAESIPQIFLALLVFGMGAGDAFGWPASQAILPSLLPPEKLSAGNVAKSIVARTATIVGPGIGGVSVFLIGGRMTFLFTAVVFFLGTILLVRIEENFDSNKKSERSPFFAEMREGLKTVRDIPWVGAMIAMSSVQLMVVLAAEIVLLPVITRREFHTNTVFALSTAAFSLGGVISALLCVRYRVKHEGRFTVLVWGIVILAPLSLAFPINETFVVVAYLIAGFSVGPWEAYWAAAVQREVPQELQGRVFSIDYMGTVGLMPLGMALVGPATNIFGERNFLVAACVFHLVVCGIALLVPGVTDFKTPKPKNYSESEQPQA